MSSLAHDETRPPFYGLMAEFDTPDELIAAAHRAHKAGYRQIDAFAPYPIEELSEALGHHHSPLPLMVLIGGIVGALAGFSLQYWINLIVYPLNIGGRPYLSWPAFIVPTFETTILFAGITAVFGMIAVNGLPQPYHPVFNVPRFSLASSDRYFLVVEAADPQFELDGTRRFLASLNPSEVTEVEH